MTHPLPLLSIFEWTFTPSEEHPKANHSQKSIHSIDVYRSALSFSLRLVQVLYSSCVVLMHGRLWNSIAFPKSNSLCVSTSIQFSHQSLQLSSAPAWTRTLTRCHLGSWRKFYVCKGATAEYCHPSEKPK